MKNPPGPGKRISQPPDIGGKPGHHPPYRRGIVVGKRKRLQVLEAVLADIIANTRFDDACRSNHPLDHNHLHDNNQGIYDIEQYSALSVMLHDEIVNGIFLQYWNERIPACKSSHEQA